MLTKYQVEQLISAGAGEREMQAEIKKDLSIVAEVYASPKDEFIAFSEFPVGEGCVDFVIFTSRSRMKIILVEVKGADFTFSIKSGAVADGINLAAQQVRERFYTIRSNYESFRRNAHLIRRSVEAGNQKYNSLPGPGLIGGCLLVDPNKDIDVSGVVIGGRTRDDYLESKLKAQMGSNANPYISYESWDSWLHKLTRS
jgi:hypothetical protein